MNKKGQVKKRRKLKVKVLFKILIVLVLIGLIIAYLYNLRIKNIYIIGNNTVLDSEIIKAAGIEDYPKMINLKPKKAKNNIKEIPLIDSVKIKRNIFGKVTIEVEESKIFFYYKYDNKYVTSSGEKIEPNDNYLGYPTLINFTPDTIFDELVKGFNKIDYNLLSMINEIEYNPYKTSEGKVIDETRFILRMNDGNTVIIDTVNIRNLDMYPTIYTSLELDVNKGTLYLDTISKDTINFRSYEAEAKEKAEKEEKKEKQEQNQEG